MKACKDCTVRGYENEAECNCQFLEMGNPEICVFHSSEQMPSSDETGDKDV